MPPIIAYSIQGQPKLTMHVAINAWFWNQPNVGSGQYVRELVRAIHRIDSSVQLTLIMPPHNPTPDDVPDGVNIVTTRGFGGKLGKVWFEQVLYPNAVNKLKADIAHVPYWGAPLSVSAKLVTSVLDVIPLLFPEYEGGTANKAYTALVRSTAQGSAHIITLSETSKKDVAEQLEFPAERISAIYLAPKEAYHPKIGSENDEAVRQKYNLPDEKFVLYIGGFDVRKRLKQLLSAYKFIVKAHGDEIPLVLAGREPEWNDPLFPNLRDYIKEIGLLEDAVIWTGYIDEDDKPSLYRLAHVFAYPSGYEGFGLPVLEAMASGTPVVANEIPVFDELVVEGAFLIEDASLTKMGGAILALIEQDELHQTVSAAGQARATNFTWRKTARETLDVYRQALEYTVD